MDGGTVYGSPVYPQVAGAARCLQAEPFAGRAGTRKSLDLHAACRRSRLRVVLGPASRPSCTLMGGGTVYGSFEDP